MSEADNVHCHQPYSRSNSIAVSCQLFEGLVTNVPQVACDASDELFC